MAFLAATGKKMDELRMARTLPVEVPISGASYSAVELADENDRVWMMDQRLLPWQEAYREIRTVERVAEGIRQMVIRGAQIGRASCRERVFGYV